MSVVRKEYCCLNGIVVIVVNVQSSTQWTATRCMFVEDENEAMLMVKRTAALVTFLLH